MPELNTMLMEQVMTFIRDNPEQHDQNRYLAESESSPCGTTACFAGHALLMSGRYQVKFLRSKYLDDVGVRPYAWFSINTEPGLDQRKTFVDVYREAKILLGLNSYEAEHLFYAGTAWSEEPSLQEAYKDVMNGRFRPESGS